MSGLILSSSTITCAGHHDPVLEDDAELWPKDVVPRVRRKLLDKSCWDDLVWYLEAQPRATTSQKMRFALSDNGRIEATPGATGRCPGCNADMVARCGTRNVWHWAHKGQRHCDPWWENETEWHREWKNQFPTDWHEVLAHDASGERHIADAKTPYGLVLEFQHSAIKPDEVLKRTTFYDHVIWIIDGKRRPTDHTQHERMLSEHFPQRFDGVDIYTVYCEETRLLKDWGSLGRIVGFDFGGDGLCLLTAVQGRSRYLFDFPKAEFARLVVEGKPLPVVQFGKPETRGHRRRRF